MCKKTSKSLQALNVLLPLGQGQCSSFTNIDGHSGTEDMFGYMRLLFNTTGTPCIRCLDSNGHFYENTMYFRDGVLVGTTDSPLTVTEGVLVILNFTEAIPNHRTPFVITCQSLPHFILGEVHFYSNSKSLRILSFVFI